MKFQFLFVIFAWIGCCHACDEKTLLNDSIDLVYESELLQIHQLTPRSFCHVSFLHTNDFGKVACNGMIVIDHNEALIFDTPTDDATSIELINWIENELKCKIKGVVATHFHNDCLGGLTEFHKRSIPSFANNQTIELAKSAGSVVPQKGFEGALVLKVGNETVVNQFIGEGHTRDNIVCFFDAEKVLFGGCLIKELGAGKGYLGDANVNSWSKSVAKVKKKFPTVKVVIPGHGKVGGQALLDYTRELFLRK